MDKQALQQELVKINQLMKLHHPRYHNPNSPGGEKYYELMKRKEEILAQLKQGVAEEHFGVEE